MGRFLTFIPTLLTGAAFAQQIPAIQNDEQARIFVQKVYNEPSYTICLKPPTPLIEPDARYLPDHEFMYYEKADFDKNGQMDLLFNGFRYDEGNRFSCRISLAILTFGKDSFQLHTISRGKFTFHTARILQTDHQAMLRILHSSYNDGPRPDSLYLETKADTLFYYQGKFIEKKDRSTHRIKSIRFSHTRPYYRNYQGVVVLITPDSTKLKAEDLNTETANYCTRLFTMQTRPAFWDLLTGLLNQIDFANLEDRYEVPWTCDDTGILTIEYNNGKIKTIFDYGKSGTYGLEVIEELLMAIDASPAWTLIAEQDGFMDL